MAGSSNFIQQNPTQANQETDSAYQSDSLTTGGIGVDAILPSAWLNKYCYQQSTFVAAFCGMMANKGYTLSDASITTLEAVLANVLTNADTKPPLVTVAYSSTPTFDCSTANGFIITLSGNVSGSSLINMQIGQTVTIIVQQNGSGGHTFAVPSAITTGHWWPVNQTANAFTVQQFTKTPVGNIVRLDTSEPDLQAAVNTINTTLTTINSEISTLQGQVSTLQGQVSTLNSEVSGINSEITTLQGQVSTLQGTLSGLSSQVSVLNSFVSNFLGSANASGYLKIPIAGGIEIILQWKQGTSVNNRGSQTISWPITFPNNCLWASVSTFNSLDDGAIQNFAVTGFNTNNITVLMMIRGDEGSFANTPFVWAIGY